jgi:hypothetical protein
MKFGQRIARIAIEHPRLAAFYIDYKGLKRLLKTAQHPSADADDVFDAQERFALQLESEITKVGPPLHQTPPSCAATVPFGGARSRRAAWSANPRSNRCKLQRCARSQRTRCAPSQIAQRTCFIPHDPS